MYIEVQLYTQYEIFFVTGRHRVMFICLPLKQDYLSLYPHS